MLQEGLITQDSLRLGIAADSSSFNVIAADGKPQAGLFTLGGYLRGELWGKHCRNEVRSQENTGCSACSAALSWDISSYYVVNSFISV
ncbi:hypothetical protein ALON55S_06667 [Alishewanella longhuensis]